MAHALDLSKRPRTRRTRSEIAALLGEFRSGGWTQEAFAARCGVSRSSLVRWLRLERDADCDAGRGDAPPVFVEARLADGALPFSARSAPLYEIEFGRARLRFGTGFAREEVRTLLGLLGEALR